jgi:HSP20 family protein
MTTLTRWDPFAEFVRLNDAMERFFDAALAWSTSADAGVVCPINAYDTGEALVVEAYLPGVSQEDIQVGVERSVLTIAAKRHGIGPAEKEAEAVTWHLQEFGPAELRRSLRLPYPVEVDQARATFVNGVLTLTLPKAEAVKPKRIAIEAGAPRQLTAAGAAK